MSLKNTDVRSLNDNEVVIKVENVSKKFSKSLRRSMVYGLKDILRNTFKMHSKSDRLRKSEFWAVKDISFELKKSECLGIVGPNGSGKTTLLSMLNGIYMPDQGKITVKGKVGALIAVGAGFHPMLSGRENIYINGAVLGMGKEEINKKFDSIVEFADIGDFLDMPVKHYSSGMYVRLGFAVAIHCEPDILLVDEILSVGDIKFRDKSQRKFMELVENGTSVVLVSHNLNTVRRVCDKALMLNKGEVIDYGEVEDVINNYSLLMNREELKTLKEKSDLIPLQRKGETGRIELFNCKVYEEGGNPEFNEIEFGKNIIIEFEYKCYEELKNPEFRVIISSAFNRKSIAKISSYSTSNLPSFFSDTGKIRFTITNNRLHHGVYLISLAVVRGSFGHLFTFNNCQQFLIKNPDPRVYRVEYSNLLFVLDFTVDHISE
ncbi:ABC transporter ATP-binding protein [Candidatus Borrarchaeum sp.]|uniref:ABC transporter ATP-binding protein n=1 Tax=Candidatus Borrarchaeum sp. TaxID=2846742 RepID=UPI00257DAF07|nr:ABC transporter ATP-binding protein [Candidatus Borrarchaeum sp.]